MTRIPILLVVLLLAFSACRTDNTSQADQESVDFTLQGNVAYIRLAAEPDRLNPLLTTSGYSRTIYELIFQPLLVQNPETFELDPLLTTSRPTITPITDGPNAGGSAYAFELHEAAVWDDGSPVTGDDFVFTLKALFNPKVNADAYRSYLNMVTGIEVDPENPKKFTVFTDRPYILSELAISTMVVYPEHVFDPEGLMRDIPLADLLDPDRAADVADSDERIQQFADQFSSSEYSRDPSLVQGSGFYKLARWESGQQIVLERKEDWWAKDLSNPGPRRQAGPERLVYRIIGDASTAANAVRDEQVDVAPQMDTKDFISLRQNDRVQEKFNLESPVINQLYFIGLNNQNPKLADKRVRRALAHTLDIEGIINNLYDSLAIPIATPVHPVKGYYAEDLGMVPFNLDKAKSLLTEAGWTDSNNNGIVDKEIDGQLTELELEIVSPSTSKFANNLALLFKDNARQVGIDITINALEFRAMYQDYVYPGKYEIYSAAVSNPPIPDDFYQMWHTSSWTTVSGGGNRVLFGNAQTDALIERIRTTLDDDERRKLYREFQEIIFDEQPVIFLFAPKGRLAISKRFDAKATSLDPGFLANEFVKSELQPE